MVVQHGESRQIMMQEKIDAWMLLRVCQFFSLSVDAMARGPCAATMTGLFGQVSREERWYKWYSYSKYRSLVFVPLLVLYDRSKTTMLPEPTNAVFPACASYLQTYSNKPA